MSDTETTENEQEFEKLPDDAAVDLQAEFERSQVQEVLDKLDNELVGLVPVKTRIKEIAALLLVDRLRRRFSLTSETPTFIWILPVIQGQVRQLLPCAWLKFYTG